MVGGSCVFLGGHYGHGVDGYVVFFWFLVVVAVYYVVVLVLLDCGWLLEVDE